MISIVIPTYNEEKFIAACLCSVLEALTEDVVEILLVDGMSTDRTQQIVKSFSCKHSIIRLILNQNKTVPFALNLGIRYAKGEYIMRIDAHSEYPKDYILACKKAMDESNAENVGGIFITLQNGNKFSAKLVQLITTHPFGIGNSNYRLDPKPHYSDTVPYGYFKRSVFKRIGYFDERLTRNQDYEFNQRILKTGGKIWLDPAIRVYYKNQSTFTGLLRQALFTGKWNVWTWKVAPYAFKIRHFIPGLFLFSLLLLILFSFFLNIAFSLLLTILLIYFALALTASVQQTVRKKSPETLFFLPFSFFLYHISYGMGIFYGFILLIIGKPEVSKNTMPNNIVF